MKRKIIFALCLMGFWVSAQAAPTSLQAACGTTVTISAEPQSGYRFDRWDDGETVNPRSVDAADITYTAYFAVNTATGWSETGTERITLLPNIITPGGQLVLQGLRSDEQTTIRVFSTTGHLMESHTSTGETTYLLEAAVVSGCYYVHVSSPNTETILRYVVYTK